MTDTTETEIKDCFYTTLRGAIEDCELLGKLPAQGPTFVRMRARLKTVENCCRQMGHWREDTRWMPVGIMMEAVHQRSRDWIVKHNNRQLFSMLADKLRLLETASRDLDTRATGRMGAILPEVQAAPTRTDSRPVQVVTPRPASSIILPENWNG